ncbi:MAG: exopolysaccharide transport family protein [Pseudomonadota bacterium]
MFEFNRPASAGNNQADNGNRFAATSDLGGRAGRPATQSDTWAGDRSEAPLAPDLLELFRSLWRRRGTVLLSTLLLTGLALLVGLMLEPRYNASTSVLIDPRGLQVVENDLTPRNGGGAEAATALVESQKRVMISDAVLGAVVEKLDLASDPEYGLKEPGIIGMTITAVRGLFRGNRAAQQSRPAIKALKILRESVRTMRLPGAYIIDLSVKAPSALRASQIANTIAQTYIDTEFAARQDLTSRASGSLDQRLDELRAGVQQAEDAVERYKRENNLVGVGGRLVSEQQLSELSSQLSAARALTAQARSRFEQIRALRRAGANPDAIAQAVQSQTITALRTRLAAASQTVTSLSAQLGSRHPRMVAARAEVADARRQIAGELDRIARGAQAEFEQAQGRERSLETAVGGLERQTLNSGSALVRLRELEREAAANRQVYETFLVRAREVSEQQSLDTSVTRIISPAIAPSAPSGTSLKLLLLGGLALGLVIGCVLALVRDTTDRTVRTPRRLFRATDLPLIGIIPGLDQLVNARGAARGLSAAGPIPDHMPPVVFDLPDGETAAAFTRIRTKLMHGGLPNAGAGRGRARRVLVTAPGAQQGKSTVAFNLALSAGQSGERVILVDGDPLRAFMSQILLPSNSAGLAELAAAQTTPEGALVDDEEYQISFLSARAEAQGVGPRLNMRGLNHAFDALEPHADLVVIDGGVPGRDPALHMFAELADDIIIVTREEVTDIDELTEAIAALSDCRHKVRGLALLAA